MLQIITHCLNINFLAPNTQLLWPYNIAEPEVPSSQIVCERLPLHLFELHQVNAIIINRSNSSSDYKRMEAISIFIEDSLSRTCELVSQQILLLCHLHSLIIGIH